MYHDKSEERLVDIGAGIARTGSVRWLPGWRADTVLDNGCETGGDRLNVCLEEACFDLYQDITYCLGFVGKFDGEAIFKLSNELRDSIDLQYVQIAKRKQHTYFLKAQVSNPMEVHLQY